MHKCIPYAKIIFLRFVEPWWFMNLSKHFPLGEPAKFQLTNLATKADFLLSKYALGIQIGEALFIRRVGQGVQSHRSQAAADENQP